MRIVAGVMIILVAGAFTGCAITEVDEKTRALNQEQLDKLQVMQARQLKIQNMVENLDPVHHAAVYVRENEVLIYPYFKPGRILTLGQRDRINEFVMRLTGLPLENIRLMVKKRKGD